MSRYDWYTAPAYRAVGLGYPLLLNYFKRFSWPNPVSAYYDSTLKSPADNLVCNFELKRYEPTSPG